MRSVPATASTPRDHTLCYHVGAAGDLLDVVRILHKHMDIDRHID